MLRRFIVSSHTRDFGDQNKLSFESLYFFVVPFSFLLKGDYNEMLDNRRVLRLVYE